MVTDTEVTPATEAPSPDGQVAPEAVVEAPPAEVAPPEPAAEAQPTEDEEIDRQAKELTDTVLGKADVEITPAAKMLSEEEATERERRAAQSAADKARAEAVAEQQRKDQVAQGRARVYSAMRNDIRASLQKVAESGEVSDGFLNDVDTRYRGAIYEEASEYVSTTLENAAIAALAAVPGMTEAKEEDFAPILKPHKTPQDKFGAYFEVAVEQGKKLGLAEAEKRMAKEVARQVREGTEAGLKKALLSMRLSEKGGELPKATGSDSGRITDKDIVDHANDPQWWEDNREAYFKQTGLMK